jgi:hypothetical protein
MPTAFKNISASLSSSESTPYTVPAATTSIIIGAHVTNADSATRTLTLSYTDASRSNTNVPLASAVSIPANSAFEPVAKLVLQAGDAVKASSSSAGLMHIALSVLEIT